MHDPLVVAFEIRRPWPRLDKHHNAKPGESRWKARYQWATWTRPWRGWMTFWTVAGWGLYWPSFITVWHYEPNGADALTVCRQRYKRDDGEWAYTKGWKWHVRHWRIQVSPLQDLRRRLLTKCEECGRKGRPNISHQWDGERGPWWRGERGLFHRECSSLVYLRRQQDLDERIIRALVAEVRLRSDESAEEVAQRLTGSTSGLPFAARYRLGKVIEPAEQEKAEANRGE